MLGLLPYYQVSEELLSPLAILSSSRGISEPVGHIIKFQRSGDNFIMEVFLIYSTLKSFISRFNVSYLFQNVAFISFIRDKSN